MIDPAVRKLGIGGSEVGAIFGCDDYLDAFTLWLRKKSDFPREAEAPNIRMIVGQALEPGVLTLYTHVTGRKVEPHKGTLQHPDRPWMVYTPDALCVDEHRGVDAKVVFWDQRRKWGATDKDIPSQIQLQCWWYMAAMDYDVWDVAALVGEGEPRVYTIERDQEAERVMLARVEEWWCRYILGNERPPIGDSEECSRWLQQAFPHHKRPDMRSATIAEIAKMATYAKARNQRKKYEELCDQLENELKLAVGEQEGIRAHEATFTWRRTKDRRIVGWESMAIALLHKQFTEQQEREELIEFYTRTEPGVRRIWFTSDLLE